METARSNYYKSAGKNFLPTPSFCFAMEALTLRFVCELEDFSEVFMETLIRNFWSIALYCVVPNASKASMKMDFLANFSCQGFFFLFQSFVTFDKRLSQKRLKMPMRFEVCFKMPSENCSAALCSNQNSIQRQEVFHSPL